MQPDNFVMLAALFACVFVFLIITDDGPPPDAPA